ncbi:helix-turn-helix domain-containing protein [uncultured Pseudoflavonifractor sp.]|uniref:helix-turn-helix domain-containing protein n=1 Tax=uncultured Pseudoflavonifractor sp. TaxID=1221379 RepID=UPI0025E24A40|nr:helix-turn-helix domain-containing protein [uncultured Pseudoflavonifractor sp.]
MEPYRVLLADDEEEIRAGISRKIDWSGLGFALVGEAENGAEALELSEQLRPDIVLTDIKMPFMDGLELCRRLRQSLPAAKLVVFSGFDDFEYARQAVGMGVSEYIMKPVNAPEMGEVLTRLREQLDKQRMERRDMETLRRRYEESLPVLRELFYTRLLDGRVRSDQVADRAARYELDMPEGTWAAALARVGGAGESEAQRDELLLLSARAFLDEHFQLAGACARSLLYNDAVALLVRLERPEQVYALTVEMERLCALARSILGMSLTVGIGQPCAGPGELSRSADGARSALDYQVLVGEDRAIYIGDLEPDRSVRLSFDEEDQRALESAVKLGSREQVEALVEQLTHRVGETRLTLPQCHIFFLEIVTAMVRLARSGGAEVEEQFGRGFTGMVSFADFHSLEELGRWLCTRCLKLHELLGRQRTNSAWKTVEQAKSFIAGHYADCGLSVESLCAHLHLSATYFSTLFKRETGKSFTAYVTELRMEQAARMLRDTGEKTYLIAEKTGYTDPNYFSYVFKRHFGVTPSKYRAGQRT